MPKPLIRDAVRLLEEDIQDGRSPAFRRFGRRVRFAGHLATVHGIEEGTTPLF